VRSLLFAPGNDERKLRKALESRADAVAADLEDAVVPAEQETAREVVAAVFGSPPDGASLSLVRVNGAAGPYYAADVEVVARLGLDGLVLPQVERAFAASDAEVEWARSVVDAYEAAEQDGAGALALDGAMVDLPVVTRARRILSEAGRRTA
jgi:citrate lyase subunit beta / citryl-CoA lyase